MFPHYPLFQSHLDLAHDYWRRLVQPGDTVIDATCGNGHDTLVLAKLALTESSGKVYALDLQPPAVTATTALLAQNLSSEQLARVEALEASHSTFLKALDPKSVKLVVYNLGYLPGGNKAVTTLSKTTLESIQDALRLLVPGGGVSITAYPGHPEGAKEEAVLFEFLATLDPREWSCCHHRWVNRKAAPSLFLVQKSH